MEGKDSFIFYTKYIHLFNALQMEQRGILITHILNYVNDLIPESKEDAIDDPVVKMAWITIKIELKADLVKWKDTCNKRSEAGKKGGRPKKEEKQKKAKKPNAFLENQTKAKKADNEYEYDNEYVLSKDNVKESVKEKSPTSRFIPPTLDEIKAYCKERNNLVDAERFYDFYSSKGWMVGKNKMKDWKAAIRTWEKEAGFKSDAFELIDSFGNKMKFNEL